MRNILRDHPLFVDIGEKPVAPPFLLEADRKDMGERYFVAESVQQSPNCTISVFSVWEGSSHLRICSYLVKQPVSIFSVPNEEVVTFHLQFGADSICSFGNMPTKTCGADMGQLFWQGKQTVEYRLSPGEHFHVDLFFKGPFVPRLLHEGQKIVFWEQDLDEIPLATVFYETGLEKESRMQIMDFADRIRSYAVSESGYDSFCQFLLGSYFKPDRVKARVSLKYLLYGGSGQGISKGHDGTTFYEGVYGNALFRLERLDRRRLLQRFLYMREKLTVQLADYDSVRSLLIRPKRDRKKINYDTRILQGLYYWLGDLIVQEIGEQGHTLKDREMLRLCLIGVYREAFGLQPPDSLRMDNYREYARPWEDEDRTVIYPVYESVLRSENTSRAEEEEVNIPNSMKEVFFHFPDPGANADRLRHAWTELSGAYARIRAGLETAESKLPDTLRKEIAAEAYLNYVEEDMESLTVLEIRYFSMLQGYMENIDDRTLRWFLVVLKSELNEQSTRQLELNRLHGYHLLVLHRELRKWPITDISGFSGDYATIRQMAEDVRTLATDIFLIGEREPVMWFCNILCRSLWR